MCKPIYDKLKLNLLHSNCVVPEQPLWIFCQKRCFMSVVLLGQVIFTPSISRLFICSTQGAGIAVSLALLHNLWTVWAQTQSSPREIHRMFHLLCFTYSVSLYSYDWRILLAIVNVTETVRSFVTGSVAALFYSLNTSYFLIAKDIYL